jgi:hypothetical protein
VADTSVTFFLNFEASLTVQDSDLFSLCWKVVSWCYLACWFLAKFITAARSLLLHKSAFFYAAGHPTVQICPLLSSRSPFTEQIYSFQAIGPLFWVRSTSPSRQHFCRVVVPPLYLDPCEKESLPSIWVFLHSCCTSSSCEERGFIACCPFSEKGTCGLCELLSSISDLLLDLRVYCLSKLLGVVVKFTWGFSFGKTVLCSYWQRSNPKWLIHEPKLDLSILQRLTFTCVPSSSLIVQEANLRGKFQLHLLQFWFNCF